MALEGKVWRYGDNIDTDVIIPARYLISFDPQELATHCMADIDKSFAENVKKGDMIVGGKNFGCGSSREHAPIAIKASGVPVIIAASFARIFYRNGINIGLPLLEIGDDVNKIKSNDTLRVDTSTGKIENLTSGDVFQAHPLPGFVEDIARAGGLINYIKENKYND
ncbi:3-isopropylmalate dehydratase small subunit [Pectinatus frisingensis]|jgi:3-isopropylmalate/(R)-2-methylmalate dehydratase small subunit|uniref:3-isopropylmalate dehydratase small subunit n=1 Tax=Pectinatus frisingensis TaxID=865 RepID=UPI0015F36DB2|nr:3-isopropylmalate dehydratase small subunit [Pectinatus frisingensis]